MGNTTIDTPEAVTENFRLAKTALGLKRLIIPHQVHGNNVEHVTHDSPDRIPSCDGVMTNEPDIGLMVQHADCQGAVFYDPQNHAVAAVHSGWRGLVSNIYGKCVEAMQAQYGSKPEDLIVGISPSLGPWNSEFVNYRAEFPPEFWEFTYPEKKDHFDLWQIARFLLVDRAGISPMNFTVTGQCTYDNSDDYYSYRRQRGGPNGRNCSIIRLLPRS
mmetsp:Transcript_17859/g.29344  ORF Transcript_17859/g.29344 Transcript_17859/m.29344 type:complete len:216 (-) Transcript_17859:290-937(-)